MFGRYPNLSLSLLALAGSLGAVVLAMGGRYLLAALVFVAATLAIVLVLRRLASRPDG